MWELKAEADHQELIAGARRPPPSPSSVPASTTPRSWSPKVKQETGSRTCASPCMPHHGAALQDYSPQRVATPPYPPTGAGAASSSSQNSNAEDGEDAAVARANSRRALNEEAALVDNAAVDMELGDEDQTVIMHVLV